MLFVDFDSAPVCSIRGALPHHPRGTLNSEKNRSSAWKVNRGDRDGCGFFTLPITPPHHLGLAPLSSWHKPPRHIPSTERWVKKKKKRFPISTLGPRGKPHRDYFFERLRPPKDSAKFAPRPWQARRVAGGWNHALPTQPSRALRKAPASSTSPKPPAPAMIQHNWAKDPPRIYVLQPQCGRGGAEDPGGKSTPTNH